MLPCPDGFLVDDWTDEDALLSWVAGSYLVDIFFEALDEIIVDSAFDVDS